MRRDRNNSTRGKRRTAWDYCFSASTSFCIAGLFGGVPFAEGASCEGRIVVTSAAGHFATEPIGAFEGGIDCGEFDFGHSQSRIDTEKLVDLVGEPADGDEPAHLFHHAGETKRKQQAGLIGRDLLFPLETRKSAVVRWSFDGEISAVVAHPHPDSTAAVGTKIALRDVGVRRGVGFVVAHHEKFAFDLYEHITRWRGLRVAGGPTRQKQR